MYVSGLIGPSFATVSSPADSMLTTDGSIFTIGAPLGVAFDRANGALRLEVEGLGRDTYDNRFNTLPNLDASTILTNNGSVLVNVWRDIMLTDRVGVDVGYRYFQINTLQPVDSLPIDFSNNELMFTVRLYEPFRRWSN